MKKSLIFVFILILCSTLAYSYFFTGNDIYNWITLDKTFFESSSEGKWNYQKAFGYIIGIFDLGDNLFWEGPLNVTAGQVRDVAIKYLREHPERRHEPASSLLIEAFQEAFPIK